MMASEAVNELNDTPLWKLYPARFVLWLECRDYAGYVRNGSYIVIDKKTSIIVERG